MSSLQSTVTTDHDKCDHASVTLHWSEFMGGYNTPDTDAVKVGHEIMFGTHK